MAITSGVFFVIFLASFALSLPVQWIDDDEDLSFFFETSDPDAFIVGGDVAPTGAHPWMVALTRGDSPRLLSCGGSIITQRTVLSAAHCIAPRIENDDLNELRLIVGSNLFGTGGQSYLVEGAAVHPHYHRPDIKNDIGTLFTASDIVYNDLVKPIALSYDFVGGSVACRIAGWGRIYAGGAISTQLLQIDTFTTTGERCVGDRHMAHIALNRTRSPPVDPRTEICTFHSNGHGNCNGDSGSALVRTDNGMQIGIVSWGFPCAIGGPDAYARVSAYRTWIRDNTR